MKIEKNLPKSFKISSIINEILLGFNGGILIGVVIYGIYNIIKMLELISIPLVIVIPLWIIYTQNKKIKKGEIKLIKKDIYIGISLQIISIIGLYLIIYGPILKYIMIALSLINLISYLILLKEN